MRRFAALAGIPAGIFAAVCLIEFVRLYRQPDPQPARRSNP